MADTTVIRDKILGGWLGRIAGNMPGKPIERGDHWTRELIERYLPHGRPPAHRLHPGARSAATIPPQWTDPLDDRVRSAMFGFDGARISNLAQRTARVVPKGDWLCDIAWRTSPPANADHRAA
jgi:hypothetical protein